MENTVAVLGATGQTGKHIVQNLLKQNLPVRVLSRNFLKAQKMFGSSVEIIEGDLLKVRELLALVDGVTHLLAAHGADGYPGERGYEQIDFGGMDKALDSIRSDQQTHVIYMSLADVEPGSLTAASFSQLFYWKRLTERMVQGSGNPYTIIRPGRLINCRGGLLGVKPEQDEQADGSVTREHVAEAMVQAMHFEGAKGRIFEIFNAAGTATNDWSNFFS
jgi:uncharacterized protein YbjT (DUF2867 family)